jgi:Mor family transcriptional regulator
MENKEMQEWLNDLATEEIEMPNYDIQLISELYGVNFALRLMEDMAGTMINVPKTGLNKLRNMYICKHYDGSKRSRISLARECNVTENYIKQLVSKNRKKYKAA